MANRNPHRDPRRGRPQPEWDWDYYSQYGYTPYSPYLRNNDYGPDYYRDEYAHETPYDNNMYYGRNTDYNRNEFGTFGEYGSQPEGPYSGYGPSGYSRPDDKIRDDINDRLTWDGRIDASDIDVTVSAGTVVLNGSVDSRRDKRVAEDIADSVSGVWDVHNHLRIRNPGHYRGRQGGIRRHQVHEGMQVVDSQGKPVGTVKEIHTNDFLMDRPAARDIYVPYTACRGGDGQVQLNISADQVDRQDWETPESPGSHKQG